MHISPIFSCRVTYYSDASARKCIPYSGKVFQGKKFGEITLFRHLAKNFGINRSAKRLLIVSTNLDDFGLVNHRQFTNFAKVPPPTFPGIWYTEEPVYYRHLGTNCKCFDYQGVLLFQVTSYSIQPYK